jgi:hypothetical protein
MEFIGSSALRGIPLYLMIPYFKLFLKLSDKSKMGLELRIFFEDIAIQCINVRL